LISYVVKSTHPFAADECTIGTGGACGAAYLNSEFENLLQNKLGPKAAEVLTPRRVQEAMRSFETTIKCQFNPYLPDCEAEYEIPLPGTQDVAKIGLEGGFIKLTRYVRC
jgi:hypothetical protein